MADTPPGHTASQTVGPFLHIALADPNARFAVADDADGAILVRGRLTDGNGDPIPDGLIETWQVDGRFARSPTDVDGRWELRTTKPPPAPTRDGTAQAPHLVMSVFARGLLDRVVTRVYFGDEEDANATDPTLAVVDPDRRRLLVATPDGANGYRFDIRLQGEDESVFIAIDAGPFDFLVNRGPVAEATSSTAWLAAMIEVEEALAQAWAQVLTVPPDVSKALADACAVDRVDAAAVFGAAEQGGNPVIPLVPMLKELAGPVAAELVHRGATSQDIFDTAAMLVVRRCSDLVRDRLVAVRGVAADLTRAHGATPMIGRTLLQHAVPTTFGAVVDRWLAGLDAARAEIGRVDTELPLQLGGPVGDRAPLGPEFGTVVALVAARLTLIAPATSWHTQRAPTAAIVGAWGLAASTIGAITLDIVLLAQSDVGEIVERAAGAGGSSSMAHKHNPIAAVSARAAVMQTPGLVATLLDAAGSHELERAAGAWHAEWPALNGLLRATVSAVDWLGISLERLHVDEQRMAANLARSQEESR